MSAAFQPTIDVEGIRIIATQRRLLSKTTVPPLNWPALEGRHGVAGSVVLACVQRGQAAIDGDAVLLCHNSAADLPSSIADTLGLPSLSTLSATLSFDGRIEEASSRIRVRWYDANTRAVAAERIGAFIRSGGQIARLTSTLYELLNRIDAFNVTRGAEVETRIAAWGPVQDALQTVTGASVERHDYLKSLSIYQAGSFALDVRETSHGIDFVPVLMSRSKGVSLEDNAPIGEGDDPIYGINGVRDEDADALLPPELQKRFVDDRFARREPTRDAYVLGRNVYLVVDPDLKIALDVVRQKRAGSDKDRRDFVRNPRPHITEAIGRDGAADVVATLFVETEQYSERILGLGVWEAPKLMWLKRQAQQWLPEGFPLHLGQRIVTVTETEISDLKATVSEAKAAEHPTVTVQGEAHPTREVDDALSAIPPWTPQPNNPDQELPDSTSERSDQPSENPVERDDKRLVIAENLEAAAFHAKLRPRPMLAKGELPRDLIANTTAPKPHQIQGFDWLVKAWASGLPGVLLADDMGLGKTFQALAFLSWVRRNQSLAAPAGRPAPKRGPILIVAPTALLNNWIAEAERHLVASALAERIDAFGSGIRRLKKVKTTDWTPEDSLDVDALRKADWILTTYETLADNHRAFARVPCSVAVFDEMQKVKSPGTINTHAAKTINADFVLGLTGTPIENRIEDLWCIMDRVTPGMLGDLKSFSATYGENDTKALVALKERLDRPKNGVPAPMLRRMKEAILEGLPKKTVLSYPISMPAPQAAAYAEAVRSARSGATDMGAMLKAIHAFRGISLHPDGAEGVDGYDAAAVKLWVARSARLTKTVEVLQDIQGRGEKAIVFLEDLSLQRVLAAAATTLFRLRIEPAIINGTVPGPKRQGIVDAFQGGEPGFDLLILSPKAAGIGLTITAANHVVHLSRWWNPAVEDQCNDRAYRIGQVKPVTIHLPIAVHPIYGDASFDVTLDGLLTRKRSLSHNMLAPPVADTDVNTLFGATVKAA
ncbi:hypothetical protein V1291_001515 [Nitrobacteraceae bacterium AZCC 1564]